MLFCSLAEGQQEDDLHSVHAVVPGNGMIQDGNGGFCPAGFRGHGVGMAKMSLRFVWDISSRRRTDSRSSGLEIPFWIRRVQSSSSTCSLDTGSRKRTNRFSWKNRVAPSVSFCAGVSILATVSAFSRVREKSTSTKGEAPFRQRDGGDEKICFQQLVFVQRQILLVGQTGQDFQLGLKIGFQPGFQHAGGGHAGSADEVGFDRFHLSGVASFHGGADAGRCSRFHLRRTAWAGRRD